MENGTVVCLRLATDYDKIRNVIQQRFGFNVTINTISRTDLTGLSPFRAFRKLQTASGDIFCIACKTLEKRPRLSVLKALLLVSGKRQAYIIDETGNIISKSWFNFLLIDLPKVIWELVVSLFVIVTWFVLLYLLKLWVK